MAADYTSVAAPCRFGRSKAGASGARRDLNQKAFCPANFFDIGRCICYDPGCLQLNIPAIT
jgi:hypothetical protein